MFKMFHIPIEKESLEAWLKILDDVTKVAFVTIPVILYGSGSVLFKIFNSLLLVLVALSLMFIADKLRRNKKLLTGEEP